MDADSAVCGAQLKLMSSWAVVCDVYFLEPQVKGEDESSQQFAERVQRMIASRAKLKIAPWDGYLKYYNLASRVSAIHRPLSCPNACLTESLIYSQACSLS